MRQPDASPALLSELPELITVPELAKVLRLSPKTVYEAIQMDKIPGVVRLGRRIRINKRAVVAWLLEGRGPQTNEE